jgi:hypothetical protein
VLPIFSMGKMAEKLGDPVWLASDRASWSFRVAAWMVTVPVALGLALQVAHKSVTFHLKGGEIVASPGNLAFFVLVNLIVFAFVAAWIYLFWSMLSFWRKVQVAPWYGKALWLMVLLFWLGALSPLYYFFVYRKVVHQAKGAA